MSTRELNVDGLVGPTHHYGGLAHGNRPSARHRHEPSNPRAAALQGLEKMLFLHRLGIPQAVLPPQERPAVDVLRRLGFAGSDGDVLAGAARDAPELLSASSSASSMWAANAATVSPPADTGDGRLHVTPANLVHQFHRSLEASTTAHLLRRMLPGDAFVHHLALPAAADLADEGAANHVRLAPDHGSAGIELFVYGRDRGHDGGRRLPARQALDASRAVARLHRLSPERTLFVRQHPDAIDAGVFHNDVACVGHRDLLLCHERAFAESDAAFRSIGAAYRSLTGSDLRWVVVPERDVPLARAVDTYLLNSQLVDRPDGRVAMICPTECRDDAFTAHWLGGFLDSGAIQELHFVEVRQSMQNGGGPACLRLRIPLDEEGLASMLPGVRMTDLLAERLRTWIHRHYRDHLLPEDLADPALLHETRRALDELTTLLGLGSIYSFQRD